MDEAMGRKAHAGALSDVIFLLGAGVSVPIGIPAMRGMYAAFLNKAKSGITNEQKRTCKFFTEELGVEADLEEFLLAASQIVEFENSDLAPFVERAVSRIREALPIRGYRQRLRERIDNARETRNSILDFMSRTCFQFNRERAADILGAFVGAVADKGYPVFTTNYDPALEYVATDRGVELHDNFVKKGQQQLWNPEIEFPLGGALTLVKLHGSVTWYTDDNHFIEKIESDTSISPMGKYVERLVIVPTRFKDIYAQHFFALYTEFLKALSGASTLVVVGHSLRDEYVRAGIIERFRTGGIHIIVIDPVFPSELPPEMKPSRLGTAGSVTHVPHKFEEFADELASLIKTSKPSELADGCAAVVHHRKVKKNKIKMKGRIAILKPGTKCSFTAVVDAYLIPQDRPALIRVWMSGVYTGDDGKQVNKISGRFLDGGTAEIDRATSGMVQEEFDMEFDIPKYDEWIAHAAKVTLHVGIVRRSAKTPLTAKDDSLIASDQRKLTYKT